MANIIISFVGAIAAVATGVFVWRQIIVFRNSERAWLSATGIDKLGELWVLDRPAGGRYMDGVYYAEGKRWDTKVKPTYLEFGQRFENYGKTPARVVEARARFHVLSAGQGLPVKPEYGEPLDIYGTTGFIAPGQAFTITKPFEGADNMLTLEDIKGMEEKGATLAWYASVIYLDAFGGKRETRICFLSERNENSWEFRISRPSEYNKYT